MPTTLAIDSNFDLIMVGNPALSDSVSKIKQELNIMFSVIEGEYLPVPSLGLPIKDFFKKNANNNALATYLKAKIMENINGILDVEVSEISKGDNQLTIGFYIKTIYGITNYTASI